MWCILEADPGAQVLAGLRPGVDATAFQEAVAGQGIEQIVVPVPVAEGDAVFTPGGRVHAIDAGCLILEVQQNSNTTYRIHDWGRVGADGKPRALHLEEALRVIRWDDTAEAKIKPRRLEADGANELWEVLRCPHFQTERLDVREPWAWPMNGKTFHVLFVAEGSVGLHGEGGARETLVAGSTCLVPADLDDYRLDPLSGNAVVWRVSHP
jgi:mannose-6-phosphate isomerase